MNSFFSIEHIDPLGQGVSKIDDQIIFVRKTLPGEEGQAEILKSSKGVQFADATELSKTSPQRINPECPHFQTCQGCHLLHTDYQTELEIKKQTLTKEIEKALKRAGTTLKVQVETIAAPRRLGYRNRIQLHYDGRKQKLGTVDPLKKMITEIPDCKIALEPIQQKLQSLYLKKSWTQEVKGPSQGHVELQVKDGEVQVHWNSRYSEGGFTQVFHEMNEILVDLVTKSVSQLAKNQRIWDLFGGGGNLTQKIKDQDILVVDSYLPKDKKGGHQKFFQNNLYHAEALQLCKEQNQSPEILLIDPPRTGFKDLHLWLEELQPKDLFYISCHQATQLRDLSPCFHNYELKEVKLLDLFPGTYHFETFFHLQRKA